MPSVVIVRFLESPEVAAAPRPNIRWTDRECDAWLMRCVTDDARSCATWTTVLRGIGVLALGAMLVVLVMSW
jgi:hypothetical protein